MASYHVRQPAEADLLDIWRYRAQSNPAGATALMRNFHRQFLLLAEYPGMGQARPDIRPGLRSFPLKPYRILYRQVPDGVEIVRVAHGSRDLHALFDEQDDLSDLN